MVQKTENNIYGDVKISKKRKEKCDNSERILKTIDPN